MRAVVIRDQQLAVEERPDPEPGAGQVLVRVRAAGLNGADMHQRLGRYPAPPGSPQDIPGLELAGEVAACGPDAERFVPGDRVMAVVGGGGQAELAVVHERQLMPVPENLSWAEAGGVPEAFTTAHDAVFTQAELKPGERLLVHGGAGGAGTAASQLVRSSARCCRCLPPVRSGCRSRPLIRWPRWSRPTSASPRAGSWGRSSSKCEGYAPSLKPASSAASPGSSSAAWIEHSAGPPVSMAAWIS